MNRVEKSITINAPVHAVFEFIREPANLLNICPNMLHVENVQRLPNGGVLFEWEYKLVGVRFTGTSTTTTFVANRILGSELHGGVHGTVIWTFESHDEQTHVSLRMDYEPPTPLARKHDPQTIMDENALSAETILSNLKAKFELVPEAAKHP